MFGFFLVCAAREAKKAKEAEQAAKKDPQIQLQQQMQSLLAGASPAQRQQLQLLAGMLGGGADAASLAPRGAGVARRGNGARR